MTCDFPIPSCVFALWLKRNVVKTLKCYWVPFRNCGKIFCSECSENNVPLPSEQLYEPVRVCATCYSSLHPEIIDSSSSNPNARRSGHTTVNSHTSSNGHSMDVPADMAESALTTFAQHRHQTTGNSCGFSYAAAVASGNAHADQRVGVSLSDGKIGNQQTQTQSRKATAAYV